MAKKLIKKAVKAVKKAVAKKVAKKVIKKVAPKAMSAMQAPAMQPPMGAPMMKKGGKMKKAKIGAKMTTKYKLGGKVKKAALGTTTTQETTKYTMKQFKNEFPKADTMPSGDLRFEDLAPLDRYDKKDQKLIMSSQKAYDTKYGKGKPATSPKKNKMGGTTKYKTGGTLTPSKKSVGKTIGKLNKAKYGSKMSKKK